MLRSIQSDLNGPAGRMPIFSDLSKAFDRLSSPIISYSDRPYRSQLITLVRGAIKHRNFLRPTLSVCRVLYQLLGAAILFPVSLLLYLSGVRLVSIDFTQIGSVIYLDALVRENLVKYPKGPKRLIACRSRYYDPNGYLIDLYRPYIRFISNPLLKFLLAPLFVNIFPNNNTFRFNNNAFRVDADQATSVSPDAESTVIYRVWNQYRERYGNDLISLTDREIARGRELLAPLLPPTQKFVAIHVRDPGYYRDYARTTRNADIRTYELAFRYLIDQGYAVVRMGDPSSDRVDEMATRLGPGFIDYAHSDLKSEFLDCYVASQCEFFVGMASGASVVSIVFGRPVCNVNYYSAATCLGYNEGDLSTFKRVRSKPDGRLVPFEELLRPPYSHNPQREELEQLGAYLEDNTPEEILAAVQEFIKNRNGGPTGAQRAARKHLRRIDFCYEAAGQYSQVSLKPYGIAEEPHPDGP